MAPILSSTARKRLGVPTEFRAYVATVGVRPQPASARPTKGDAKPVKVKAPKLSKVDPAKGKVDSCGNRCVPLTAAQRMVSGVDKPAHTLDWGISGLGAYRSFRSHQGKSFPTSKAVRYTDPGVRQTKDGQDIIAKAAKTADPILTEL